MDNDSTLSPIDKEIADACIAIVDRERTNWEDAVSFITPKVGFRMRELIRILRKNYWGIFDEPYDKFTTREKTWIGLAMSTVETWVKNVDMDLKDMGFIARLKEGFAIVELTRLKVKDYLSRLYFGEIVDSDERQVLIDGTVVWKTWESRNGKIPVMNRRTVDLLNFYIDPTEENIQSAYRVTERAILLPEQFAAMDGWENTKDLPGSQSINRIDGSRKANFGTKMTGDFRDAWELWGKIPKWLVTKDKNADDAMFEIDGHIVISGLEAPKPTFHLVEENKKKDKFGNVIKPYEEWRACKISGRWYGLGVVERVLALQEYLNTVINIRINRGYVSQLGLFKIKKGKGITAQMLNRLPVNGGITVSDMDDIEQFQLQEAGVSSYKDEEVIKFWAQQISSAMPISNGDTMPASTSATGAAIANSSAKSSYTMFKEGTGLFWERWMDRQALPIIAKTISKGDVLKLTAEDSKFKELMENIAIHNVGEALDKSDIVPSHEELMNMLSKEEERLKKSPNILVENIQDIIAEALDTKVHVTNEDLDSSVTVQNLISLLPFEQNNPEGSMQIKRQIYDLLGLDMPAFSPQTPVANPGPVSGAGLMNGSNPNLQNITQQAMSPVA